MQNYGATIRWRVIFRRVTIMSRVLRFGIMLTVAVHMVLGCCLHHAHGSHPADSPSVEDSCGCGHHGHEEGTEPSDHQSSDHGCDGDQCVFTLPESGSAAQLTVGLDCLPCICVAPTLPGMNGIDSVDTRLHQCGPPIPLHLLNQVLLI